jgi:hypothetical protein
MATNSLPASPLNLVFSNSLFEHVGEHRARSALAKVIR